MRSRRRYLLLLPAAALIGLVGCGSSDPDTAEQVPTTEALAPTSTADADEMSTTTSPADEDTTDDTTASTESEDEAGDASGDEGDGAARSPALEGFEERDVLERTVPDIENLRPIVETDNPGTRVILFENSSGRKVYKSVFVKHDQRLKVLDLDGGPPLFDERI